MRQRTPILLFCGLVGLAAGVGVAMRFQSPPREQPVPDQSPEPRTLSYQSPSVRTDTQEEAQPQPSLPPALVHAAARPHAAQPPPSDEKLGMPETATLAMQKRWESEANDESWAMPLEEGVRDIFSDPELAGADLLSVDCRTTLCRIELSYDSEQTFKALVRLAGEREPLSGHRGVSHIEPSHLVTFVEARAPQQG